jgi:hypothetical protein
MSDPMRLRDGGGELPDDLRAALRKAPRPTGPDGRERAAMLAMAAQLGAMPAPRPGTLAKVGGWKAIGAAGLLVIGAGAVVPAIRARSHVAIGAHVAVNPAVPVPQTSVVSAPAPVTVTATVAPMVEPAPVVVPAPAPTSVAPLEPRVGNRLARAPSRAISLRTRGEQSSTVALAGAAVEHDPANASACPVAVTERVTVEVEARVLASAMRALGSEPATTLACIHDLEAHGGPVVLRDEHWFLGFSASRRLGRMDDARRWANALLRGAPDSPYAMRVTRFLDGER